MLQQLNSFNLIRTPEIIFGAGKFAGLDRIISRQARSVLLVTGVSSFRRSSYYQQLIRGLEEQSVIVHNFQVGGEPSPGLVDEAVRIYRPEKIDLVVAVGGGSVIDTGKAVSALLPCGDPVLTYLEGVGAGREHSGEKAPFIAVPTTAGTGAEATNNAVLSQVGADGFKKSLRHNNFVPDTALVDPVLTLTCPPEVTAASGLDALSQLFGSYLSTRATPVTDALILSALDRVRDCLVPAATNSRGEIRVREGMSYAALISGICLPNAGYGIVHGLAGPIGGFFDIPHGVVCGTLLAEAVRTNIRLLEAVYHRDSAGEVKRAAAGTALKKYAAAGALFAGAESAPWLINNQPEDSRDSSVKKYCSLLVETLEGWIDKLPIKRLGEYGVGEDSLDKIIAKATSKFNPVQLSPEEIRGLLLRRL